MKNLNYNCPACCGDGKETCNNPDHGFYAVTNSIGTPSAYDACNGGTGCPVCGWDEEHKVKSYNSVKKKYEYSRCEACNGLGRVTETRAIEIMKEWNIDEDPDYFITESGVTILIP